MSATLDRTMTAEIAAIETDCLRWQRELQEREELLKRFAASLVQLADAVEHDTMVVDAKLDECRSLLAEARSLNGAGPIGSLAQIPVRAAAKEAQHGTR